MVAQLANSDQGKRTKPANFGEAAAVSFRLIANQRAFGKLKSEARVPDLLMIVELKLISRQRPLSPYGNELAGVITIYNTLMNRI